MFTIKRNSWTLVAVVVMLSMLLAQCAPAATQAPAAPTEAPKPAPVEGTFKVGLLSPGPVNDQGWNQLAYDSLLAIEKELDAEISYVEVAESPAEFEKALTDYASQGYQFVIAHGYQFQDAVEKVAPQFPDTVFVTSGGEKFGPNYGPVVMALWEPLYLVGVIAGNLSKTGKGAYIGGMEIPAISGPYEGLKQGFESVEGNSLTITYINSWEDVGAAKEAALAAVAQGADFIVGNANIAGTGVFQVANENKIWTAGLNADQTSEAPDYVLANGVIDYPNSFITIAKQVKDGTFEGNRPIVLTLKDEAAVYMTYNPKTQALITPEIQALVDDAAAKIKSGEILVDGDYTRKPAAPAADAEPFKVGLLSPGPVNDQGWNQLAYDSLLAIEKELGAEISYVEVAESPAEFEKALTDYASQGYQFVIAHGYQFQDAVEKVAPQFPDTVFVTSGGEKFGPNYGPVVMALWEPLYLVGVIAGNLSKTGKGAYIGGMEIPAISGPYEGLKQGFESVEGNSLTITYINSWEDVGAAKEAALAAVAQGADFIVGNANIAGTGVFQVANENKIWTAGLNADQTSEAPDYVLANGVIDYPNSFITIAKQVKDGTFEGNRPIVLTLKDEAAVYMTYNPKTQALITPEIQALVDDAAAKIKSGEILVDGDYTRK